MRLSPFWHRIFPMFIHLLEIYIIHESLKIHLTIRETLTDDFGNQSRNESLAVADAHLESIKNEMLWKSSYPKSVRRVSPGTTIGFTKGKCWDIYLLLISVRVSLFITPILKSLVVPVIWLALIFTNCTIFCFKSHLFPSQWGGYTKSKTIKLQEN